MELVTPREEILTDDYKYVPPWERATNAAPYAYTKAQDPTKDIVTEYA